ncbi:MAG: glycosyltransferase family protein [Gemmatimonadaceae bacterium]
MRGLKYVSLYGPTGYGEAARRYMLGLSEAGVPFTWTPIDAPPTGQRGGPAEYDTVLVHAVPEYYARWVERERGKRIVGYAAWETDRPPAHWPALLNSVDLLLVPCQWNREVFRAHGVTTRMHVVPHSAPEPTLPAQRQRERFGLRPGDFCFYTIGEWNARKAVHCTIQAYLETFSANDPVVLIVKTTPVDATRGRWLGRLSGTRGAVKRLMRRHERPARVVLVTDALSDSEILALHSAGDCYVSLTRGEGWGLGAFDAAAFGRPVIMTGSGGQLDWLTPDYPFLVNHRLVPVDSPRARASYSPDQHWAEADRRHAGLLMRDACNAPAAAAATGHSLMAHVRRRFNRAAVTQRLLEALA